MNWKKCGRKLSWANCSHDTNIFLEISRETTATSHNSLPQRGCSEVQAATHLSGESDDCFHSTRLLFSYGKGT